MTTRKPQTSQQATGNQIAEIPAKRLIGRMAERFGVDENKLVQTLKATAFRQSGDQQVSNEQMMALMVVSDQYGLNPFLKEIYAFPDKNNGIVPIVGVDGWLRIINDHPQFNGMEFRYSDETTKMEGAKDCPDWCEVLLYRKDRTTTTVVREYLDEVYQPKRGNYAGPWQTHTKRMLRHKALIQGARVAFGFAGIYDEDEATRIIDARALEGEYTVSAPKGKPVTRPPQRKKAAAEPEQEPEAEQEDDFVASHEAAENGQPGDQE